MSQVLVRALIDEPITTIAALGGGRNGAVFRVDCRAGHRCVVKQYGDKARYDRARAAFALFAAVDCRVVPRAHHWNGELLAAVFEYVDGQPIGIARAADVDSLYRFFELLQEYGRQVGGDISHASEACFSLAALLDNLTGRISRLRADGQPIAEIEQSFETFLEQDLSSLLECFGGRAETALRPDVELSDHEKVLSPSDFGFHNCIRRNDGSLAFVDFEHFGWDDPAKTVADFLLHPGMELSVDLRQHFAERLLKLAPVERRVVALLPLYALKWCCILLNEFIPSQFDRRRAAGDDRTKTEAQQAQLAAARAMLALGKQAVACDRLADFRINPSSGRSRMHQALNR